MGARVFGRTGRRAAARGALALALVLGATLTLAGCGSRDGAPAPMPGVPRVFVSVAPQGWLVERLAGEGVAVEVLAPPGDCGHTYEPTPQQVARLVQARAYFRTGLEFETPLLEKLGGLNAGLHIVDLRQGIALREMVDDDHDHDGGGAGEGTGRGTPDPHIWLAPRLAIVQARTIAAELARLFPARRAEFESRLKTLVQELEGLDARVAGALAPYRGRKFLVYHGVFGYFADAYGLEQRAVESWGREPSAKQVAALAGEAKRAGAKVIFVRPGAPPAAADAVARAIGGTVTPLDPLAKSYYRDLEQTAAQIARSLGGAP